MIFKRVVSKYCIQFIIFDERDKTAGKLCVHLNSFRLVRSGRQFDSKKKRVICVASVSRGIHFEHVRFRNMDTMKKRRSAHRRAFNRLANQLDVLISKENADVKEIETRCEMLQAKEESLKIFKVGF